MTVFYDLPVETSAQRSAYHAFRKALMAEGYIRMQKSVYVKLLRNTSGAAAEIKRVRSHAPGEGNVSVLPLSLGAFREMVTVLGDPFRMDIFADDLVFL